MIDGPQSVVFTTALRISASTCQKVLATWLEGDNGTNWEGYLSAIQSTVVEVDTDVTGLDWEVIDLSALARTVAVVALGQAQHAARIIKELEPAVPAFSAAELIEDAKGQMLIRGETEEARKASRFHRDGFLFECMSWIVARQSADDRTFLKDPHIDATSHGLDGLVIELHPIHPVLMRATICEDKCTGSPRRKFRREVMKTFDEHHQNKRARDLVANVVALIRESGLNGTHATKAAARVLKKGVRSYRAALTTKVLTSPSRTKLFKGFSQLDGLTQAQRIGATLTIDGDLRDWFQDLADATVAALENFLEELDPSNV